jgi:ABC-type transport system involved in cytochrome bd biosynthesis fused ATPase/permease subunit
VKKRAFCSSAHLNVYETLSGRFWGMVKVVILGNLAMTGLGSFEKGSFCIILSSRFYNCLLRTSGKSGHQGDVFGEAGMHDARLEIGIWR